MADSARLVIEIEDRPAPGTPAAPPSGGSGGSSTGGGGGGGYYGGGGNGGGGGGSGPGPGPGGGSWDEFDRRAGQFRDRISRTQQALRNVGPAGRSYERLAKDSLAAGGRPDDASDEEWLWYSRESGRRGQTAGRAAVRGAEQRRKQEEAFEKYLDAAKERVRKEEERRREQEQAAAERERLATQQRNATWAATAAGGAAGAATGQDGAGKSAGRSVGSSVGAVAGEALGAAVGGPIGAAVGGAVGSVVGGQIGEKIGERIDDPLLELTNTFNALNKGVQFAGRSLVQVAGNDGIGLFVGATEAAADQLERVPVVGKALSAEFRLLATTVGTAKQVLDAFAARGRELSGYNSALAGATARQDVALLLADIREADRLGDKLSRVVDAQTKLELFVREMLLPIKEFVADKLPGVVDTGIHSLIAAVKLLEFTVPGFVLVFGKMSDDLERMRKAAEAGVAVDPEEMWFKGLERVAGPGPAPGAAPVVGAAPLAGAAPVAAAFGPP